MAFLPARRPRGASADMMKALLKGGRRSYNEMDERTERMKRNRRGQRTKSRLKAGDLDMCLVGPGFWSRFGLSVRPACNDTLKRGDENCVVGAVNRSGNARTEAIGQNQKVQAVVRGGQMDGWWVWRGQRSRPLKLKLGSLASASRVGMRRGALRLRLFGVSRAELISSFMLHHGWWSAITSTGDARTRAAARLCGVPRK
ncbi:uncharacterized protein J3D65DRAFT_415220 [Phyllosticta citribraziliensis]|uniref:Uncharacterized protein n=1 Tax=Phyllosticta citribraziliensis TaxID=989973 RepID=A0ABR1LME9_9PEZI